MFGILKTIFGGGSLKNIEGIVKEVYETEEDKAKAIKLRAKTIDPNGLMRRFITIAVTFLFALFILLFIVLVLGLAYTGNPNFQTALDGLQETFKIVDQSFWVVLGGSFGVNAVNSWKDK